MQQVKQKLLKGTKSVAKALWKPARYVLLASVSFFLSASLFFQDANNKKASEYRVAENLQEYLEDFCKGDIYIGSGKDRVIPLQMMLMHNGYDFSRCGTDGNYGKNTLVAVRDFQTKSGLPVTGTADTATLQALKNITLNNPEAVRTLDSLLIRPYQKEEIKDLVEGASWQVGRFAQPGMILRPDAVLLGYYDNIAHDVSDRDSASLAFPECENVHQRDAFRRSEGVFRMSDHFWISSGVARNFSDFRERTRETPLPCKLMDIYNHHVAEKMADEYRSTDQKETPAQYIAQGIKTGKLVIYPLPLIHKNKN